MKLYMDPITVLLTYFWTKGTLIFVNLNITFDTLLFCIMWTMLVQHRWLETDPIDLMCPPYVLSYKIIENKTDFVSNME